MGFLVIGYFWGHPQPHFIAGLAGSVSLRRTFRVNKGTYSSSNSVGASSLSGLIL